MKEQRRLTKHSHHNSSNPQKATILVITIIVAVFLLAGITVFMAGRAKKEDTGEKETAESMDDEGMEGGGDNAESQSILAVDDLPETDLNRNGIPEELRIVDAEEGDGKELEVWESGERIHREAGGYVHTGQKAVFLCRLDGEDYLLRYRPTMYQGCGDYDYELFTMVNDGENTAQQNAVSFDINFGSPIHGEFEAEKIAAFMEEVNGLLAQSIPLIVTDNELSKTFEKEGALRDTLWWLDGEETGFVRDYSRSLSENLRIFEETMNGKERKDNSIDCQALPFEQGMEMIFSSGAGAWRTCLTLYPDGSFSGEYTDSDAGWTGEGYPNGTVFICRFHGCFGAFRQMDKALYSLRLEQLEIDTGYPIGEEWIEDGVRYISSAPYGLDGEDGDVLAPGADFLLYTPEASGHKPGCELYGAAEFCSWIPWNERREFRSESDRLECYGLHNLKTDYGFFSTGIMEADFGGYFDGLKGAAVLYDAEDETYMIYQKELADERTSPCSTFKIISSCIALENGVMAPDESLRRWSGEIFWNEKWNRDIDFREAFRESCVWYFREVIDEIGPELMQEELNALRYGNGDISDWEGRLNTNNSNPALTGFWIESSLKISPKEQTEVMEHIFGEDTVYSADTIQALKEVMLEQEQASVLIYGKTGMGKAQGVIVDAWYTGFAEKKGQRVYFCVYLGENGDRNASSSAAKEIAKELIMDYFGLE